MAGPSTNLMTLTGNEKSAFGCLLAGTVLSAVLCLALIPWFGMIGAAIGNSLGLIVLSVLMTLSAHRLTGLRSSVFGTVA